MQSRVSLTSQRTREVPSPQRYLAKRPSREDVEGGTTFVLVACGATNPQDGSVFSDFMGYCLCFREFGVNGTFISCFPLEQCFADLKSRLGVDSIKFGNEQEYLASYSRHEFALGESRWWRQVDMSGLKDEVVQWIQDASDTARPGDTVHIVFEGYGRFTGGHTLGDQILAPHELVTALENFRSGVAMNIILGGCYSGYFTDLVKASGRKGRFTEAAVITNSEPKGTAEPSGGKAIPGFPKALVQYSSRPSLPDFKKMTLVGQHAETKATHIVPGYVLDGTQTATPYSGALKTEVLDMIIRRKLDVSFNPSINSRMRRAEWPSFDERLLRKVQRQSVQAGSTSEAASIARDVIDAEIEKFEPKHQIIDTDDEYCDWYRKNKEKGTERLLLLLCWRSRKQPAVWDVFNCLVERGLLSLSSLRYPIYLSRVTGATSKVIGILSCFTALSHEAEVLDDSSTALVTAETEDELALHWLSTMIVRSFADFDAILDFIRLSRILGDLDCKQLEEFQRGFPGGEIKVNLREGIDTQADPETSFGFWLPSGLGDADQMYNSQNDEGGILQRFKDIEAAFEAYYGGK
ncbi:hypothetical protein ABW19_dt0210448 [Dactylella cylindrospora]|nr:hypothetical protein ABW19_dt0210448 [Dactylella cylindrospora]